MVAVYCYFVQYYTTSLCLISSFLPEKVPRRRRGLVISVEFFVSIVDISHHTVNEYVLTLSVDNLKVKTFGQNYQFNIFEYQFVQYNFYHFICKICSEG